MPLPFGAEPLPELPDPMLPELPDPMLPELPDPMLPELPEPIEPEELPLFLALVDLLLLPLVGEELALGAGLLIEPPVEEPPLEPPIVCADAAAPVADTARMSAADCRYRIVMY